MTNTTKFSDKIRTAVAFFSIIIGFVIFWRYKQGLWSQDVANFYSFTLFFAFFLFISILSIITGRIWAKGALATKESNPSLFSWAISIHIIFTVAFLILAILYY